LCSCRWLCASATAMSTLPHANKLAVLMYMLLLPDFVQVSVEFLAG
jgi:hypothetical protein